MRRKLTNLLSRLSRKVVISVILLGFSGPAFAGQYQIPVDSLYIRIDAGNVTLTWKNHQLSPAENQYLVAVKSPARSDTLTVSENFYSEPLSGEFVLYTVFFYLDAPFNPLDEIILEDFESGTVTLTSYPEEDREPNSWSMEEEETYLESNFSLLVYGNTWKVQEVDPIQTAGNTIWGIAVNAYNSGAGPSSEICAFGVGDGVNELFYPFRGSEMADSAHWRNTFFCVGNEDEWIFHQLPIGIDWFNAYGYYPAIENFIYLNDEDAFTSNGGIYFDYICDLTDDMPLPPEIWVDFEQLFSFESPGMTFQFTADAEDPDSDTLYYQWEFGENIITDEQNPIYTFPFEGYFTVEAQVRDETGLIDRQTIHIEVPFGVASEQITVNFTGDVMMARRYQETGGIIPTLGPYVIWEPTLGILDGGADLSIINLECVFTNDTSIPHPTKEYIFHGWPSNLLALEYAGIDGVSLANNHTMDYMEPGLYDTQNFLDSLEIKRCGSGSNEYESMQPMVNYSNGISVCNLGYCNRTGRADNLPPFMESGPNKPGFTWFTEYYLSETVPQAAELYDIVAVQVHCGTEYSTTPDTSFGGDAVPEIWMELPLTVDSTTLELQYQAIDMGADIVIAHHPHVLQGYEVYDGKLIAHSMGNFVFDQNIYETFPSMIIYAEMDAGGILQTYFRPVYIDDYIPKPATGELGRAIIDRIADYSAEMSTIVMPLYEENLAFIALNPSQINSSTWSESLEFTFQDTAVADTMISNPLELEWEGFLTSLDQITGLTSPNIEIRLGREMLWFGNFEDEGSTMWDLDSDRSEYSEQIRLSGERSMSLNATVYDDDPVEIELENRFSLNDDYEYTLCGFIKGINANTSAISINYYNYRYSGGYQGTQVAGRAQDGIFDWTCVCEDLEIPDDGYYGNIELRNAPPVADEGWAWFDEVKLIKWDGDWQPYAMEIPQPNNYRFIQIRVIEESSLSGEVHYTITQYEPKAMWFN